jgi:cysteine synthase B
MLSPGVTTNATTSHFVQPKASVWRQLGHTPLVRLTRLPEPIPDSIAIYAKLEWTNPGGSIKDRPAAAIIQAALNKGQLGSGQILLDSTSGNMGIAYATLCAPLSIPVHLVVPANASPERLAMLRALGAVLTLSDPMEGTDGAQALANETAAAAPGQYYYANQYNNPANWEAHYSGTGPEILEQTRGRVTHVFSGLGTTGTMMGVGKYLRQHLPSVELVGIQPDSPLHGLEGLKHLPTSIQPGIYDRGLLDRVIHVTTEEAYAGLRMLARHEGWLAGISSGAVLACALSAARELTQGVFVLIFPDSAAKYLSLPFWSQA